MASVQSERPQAIADSGVLIVGGTSGIGRAAARAFIAAGAPRLGLGGRDRPRGAGGPPEPRAAARAFIAAGAPRLVLVGRDRQRGAAVRHELRALSPCEVHFVAADLRDV